MAQGQLQLYYAAQIGASQNIFVWSQSSGQSTAVTSGAAQDFNVQTDGQRVAWQDLVNSNPSVAGYTLGELDIAANTQQTLSTNDYGFALGGGLLGWFEITPDAAGDWVFKVSDGTVTTTVLTGNGYSNPTGRGGGVQLLVVGASGGDLVFVANSSVYAWNASSGLQVLYAFATSTVLISGKTVYVVPANSTAVYSTTLS